MESELKQILKELKVPIAHLRYKGKRKNIRSMDYYR